MPVSRGLHSSSAQLLSTCSFGHESWPMMDHNLAPTWAQVQHRPAGHPVTQPPTSIVLGVTEQRQRQPHAWSPHLLAHPSWSSPTAGAAALWRGSAELSLSHCLRRCSLACLSGTFVGPGTTCCCRFLASTPLLGISPASLASLLLSASLGVISSRAPRGPAVNSGMCCSYLQQHEIA